MSEEIVLKVIKDVYLKETKAASGWEDAVSSAMDGEPLPRPDTDYGRANDVFAILEHIYKAATFIKCVVDVAIAARKEGREVKKEEVTSAARDRRIYLPSDDEVRKILDASRRLMG